MKIAWLVGDTVEIHYARKSDDAIHIYEGVVAEVEDDSILLANVTAEHYDAGEVGKIKRFLADNILDYQIVASGPAPSTVTATPAVNCCDSTNGGGSCTCDDNDTLEPLSGAAAIIALEILVNVGGMEFREAVAKVRSQLKV